MQSLQFNENTWKALWIRFLEGNWQRDFGEARRWGDQEDIGCKRRSEGRFFGDEREAKWLDFR